MDGLRPAIRPAVAPAGFPYAPYGNPPGAYGSVYGSPHGSPSGPPYGTPYEPHPTGTGVVGTYVQHSYGSSRQPYQHVPAMRPAAQQGPGAPSGSPGFSATPIYDALYSEYRRSFRALPGDRSDEEDLRFRGFAASAPRHGGASGLPPYGQGPPAPYGGYAALPPAPRREV